MKLPEPKKITACVVAGYLALVVLVWLWEQVAK